MQGCHLLRCTPPAAMHDLDPVFRRWTRSPKVAALMAALGFARPLPVQVGPLGAGCARGRAVGAMFVFCSIPCCPSQIHPIANPPNLPAVPLPPRSAVHADLQAAVCGRGGGAAPGARQPGLPLLAAAAVRGSCFGLLAPELPAAPATTWPTHPGALSSSCSAQLSSAQLSSPCTAPGLCLPGNRAVLVCGHLAGTGGCQPHQRLPLGAAW